MSANRTYKDACLERRISTVDPDQNYRSAFRRDYARLIHSAAFRRLQGKTQLYPGHESDFFRNRLTHSLEVAQIAKSIAQKMNQESDFFRDNPINEDLVEFAGLAHDLGHPPFGHNGEQALDLCMKEFGGFEGNAQTLRLISVIEKKQTSDGEFLGIQKDGTDVRVGLNTTFRTMASILKYDNAIPHRRQENPNLVKGYYQSERELVIEIRKHVAPDLPDDTPLKTVECQIMDVADDIAYSTYDLEDGLKSGFTDPLMMQASLVDDPDLLARVVRKVKKECPSTTADIVIRTAASIFDENLDHMNCVEAYDLAKKVGANGYLRTALTSELVNEFINGVEWKENTAVPALSEVELNSDVRTKVEVLKHLNYELMIMSPRLRVVHYRGSEIVRSVFEALDRYDGHTLLPEDFRQAHSRLGDTDAKKRLICDFVAGMTDRYAMEFYSRLTQGDQSIFKPF